MPVFNGDNGDVFKLWSMRLKTAHRGSELINAVTKKGVEKKKLEGHSLL